MKLQTQLSLQSESNQITYDSEILLLGSCFTENIGSKLDYYKFQNLQNPFGVIFNPISIERIMERVVRQQEFSVEDVFEQDEIWHCLEVHSLVSGSQMETYLEMLNRKLQEFHGYLQKATHLILTVGTAWVYRYNDTGRVVANCHKIPQSEFTKLLLSPEEIARSIKNTIQYARGINEDIDVITTVSPVRHLKDGFVENSRSKAHLIAATQEVSAEGYDVYYFPSYELMMDELRDYRYYTSDLLHPNETAIAIIWDRFKTVWVSPQTEEIQKEVEAIQKGLAHRSFHENTATFRKFQQGLKAKIETLEKRVPRIKF